MMQYHRQKDLSLKVAIHWTRNAVKQRMEIVLVLLYTECFQTKLVADLLFYLILFKDMIVRLSGTRLFAASLN